MAPVEVQNRHDIRDNLQCFDMLTPDTHINYGNSFCFIGMFLGHMPVLQDRNHGSLVSFFGCERPGVERQLPFNAAFVRPISNFFGP